MPSTLPAGPDVELLPAESALLASIKFDYDSLRDYDDANRNGEATCALAKSLLGRNAIPEVRVKYFTDANYYPGGRGRSRLNNFERNNCRGDDVLTHPHFLKYLRYFLFGATLPPPVRIAFQSAVTECGRVSSSDVIPLGKFARQLVREYKLAAHEACEEFHKLALDCGVWYGHAEHIRNAVKRMR